MIRLSKKVVLFVLATFILCCCQTNQNTTDEKTGRLVEFKGRKIDLTPYFEGFPYSGFNPVIKANKLFYYKSGETTELKMLEITDNVDFEQGETISGIDFSKRNVWGITYNENDNCLYWSGDEINDEVLNLYKLNIETKELIKLTDVPYIFSWGWNEDKNKIAYIARLGTKDERLGELRVLDLVTMEETVIVQDSPEFRLTWGSVNWRPDDKGVVVNVYKDAHRSFGNLAYIDFKKKEMKVITEPEVKKGVGILDDWVNNDEFIYTSNESGYSNLYKYNIANGNKEQITSFSINVGSPDFINVGEDKFILCKLSNPIETKILVLDPDNGETIFEKKLDENIYFLDVEENKVLASFSSAVTKFRIDELTFTNEAFNFETKIDIPENLKQAFNNTVVERVEFPTFDIDSETGDQRMLHAYLFKPKNPLPKKEQIVMIQSFYGGSNIWIPRTQILNEAGIYVLSPAPRGSSGFSKEFLALNDKDLGGNEIVDVIYAAKYISEKLDIPSERIGTFGGSHGGYATMRLLTFPGEINGNEADFDWGFGLSHAGFSDIIHFYEHCNIPDWVVLEAGDPKTEVEKLNGRSPLFHADKAVGKLLLTHGTNDQRVPIEGSRMMADSLKKYGKDYQLVEFEGQGHGIKGLENSIIYYNTWFDFLETIGNRAN